MTIYYQDDRIILFHGDSLEILPTIEGKADALLTDPPYFKVKNEDWDRQWAKPDQFLEWLGQFLDLAVPKLEPHASVWVFASPQMAVGVELLMRDRLNVLNSIRWVKSAGWHQKISLPSLRAFTTPWEAVIFAEQFGADGTTRDGLWASVFEPLRLQLNNLRERGGMSVQEVNARWQEKTGTKGQTPGHWFARSQWAFPTREGYTWLIETLGVAGPEYDALRAEYDALRRPFTVRDRKLASDIWDFEPVRPYPGKHPCEKPTPLLRHMIETSTRPGATVLDPFAGSGSTLEVAAQTGRYAIGVEKSEAYCEKIARRLSARSEQTELFSDLVG